MFCSKQYALNVEGNEVYRSTEDLESMRFLFFFLSVFNFVISATAPLQQTILDN